MLEGLRNFLETLNHQTWMERFQETAPGGKSVSKVLSSVPTPTQIGNSGRVPRSRSLLPGMGTEALRAILRPQRQHPGFAQPFASSSHCADSVCTFIYSVLPIVLREGETEPDDEETEAQRGLSSLPEVRVSKWRSLDSKSQKLAPEPQQ